MPDPRPKRSGPPRNSGVRDLVSNLRGYHTPQTREMGKAGFRGWHERGFLPHYDVPNATQFVTFGLEDSIPPRVWETILAATDDRERRRRLEAAFDGSHGACHLRRSEIADLVENALRFFHGQRYDLRAWCIMPNHVHVLFQVVDIPMSEIVDSWKSFTSREANRLLGRSGQRFWRPDYFDIFQRDANHEVQTVRYIEQNPCKAKLILDAKEWRWSSARLRDEFGRLSLEPGAGGPPVRTAAILAAAASPISNATSDSQTVSTTNALRPEWPRSASAAAARKS
ncbi:MAG TPA: transposase [Verrucomicrobiae bacterium]|nr:transposase [Verrucomicrobiae bacterium]